MLHPPVVYQKNLQEGFAFHCPKASSQSPRAIKQVQVLDPQLQQSIERQENIFENIVLLRGHELDQIQLRMPREKWQLRCLAL